MLIVWMHLNELSDSWKLSNLAGGLSVYSDLFQIEQGTMHMINCMGNTAPKPYLNFYFGILNTDFGTVGGSNMIILNGEY